MDKKWFLTLKLYALSGNLRSEIKLHVLHIMNTYWEWNNNTCNIFYGLFSFFFRLGLQKAWRTSPPLPNCKMFNFFWIEFRRSSQINNIFKLKMIFLLDWYMYKCMFLCLPSLYSINPGKGIFTDKMKKCLHIIFFVILNGSFLYHVKCVC